MVFIPEAFDFIGETKEETFSLAETIDGHLISSMKDLAKNKKVWLSLGGAHIKVICINTHSMQGENLLPYITI